MSEPIRTHRVELDVAREPHRQGDDEQDPADRVSGYASRDDKADDAERQQDHVERQAAGCQLMSSVGERRRRRQQD